MKRGWTSRRRSRIADPGRDLDRAPVGPLHPVAADCARTARAALDLARLAGLLPALWLLDENAAGIAVRMDEIIRERTHPAVEIVARAKLPLEDMPPTQIVAFRASDDGQEHVALVVGAFGGQPPLVRLHSECLTGDVFGSLKCDCGPQLREALRIIGGNGGGVLLYLRQEGRGIGLANKLRAYALQDRGLDTVDANRRLGFIDDARDYGHAAAMLRALGINEVRLLTNNPGKLAGLEAAGIQGIGTCRSPDAGEPSQRRLSRDQARAERSPADLISSRTERFRREPRSRPASLPPCNRSTFPCLAP